MNLSFYVSDIFSTKIKKKSNFTPLKIKPFFQLFYLTISFSFNQIRNIFYTDSIFVVKNKNNLIL